MFTEQQRQDLVDTVVENVAQLDDARTSSISAYSDGEVLQYWQCMARSAMRHQAEMDPTKNEITLPNGGTVRVVLVTAV